MVLMTDSALRRTLLLLLLCGALAFGLHQRTRELDAPFVHGHLGTGASHIANFVRNSLRYGLIATKFSKVDNLGPVTPEQFRYAVNHPPLTPLLYIPLALLSGQKEWGFRVTALAFAALSWAALFRLARRLRGNEMAILLLALGSCLAMAAFYDGQIDVQGPDVTAFSMLALLCYAGWLEDGSRARLWRLGAFLVLAMLTGWPAYYLAFALVVDLLVFRDGARPIALALGITAGVLVMIGLYVVYIGLLKNQDAASGLSVLDNAQKFRSPLMLPKLLENPENARLFRFYLHDTPARVFDLYGLPGSLLAAVGLGRLLYRGVRRSWTRADRVLIILLWFGGLHVAIFWIGAIIHDYWWKYLVPAFAWSAADGALLLASFVAGQRAALRSACELLLVGAVALTAIPVLDRFYGSDQATSAWILGREARARTRFDEVVLCPQPPSLPVLRYYVDRYLEVRIKNETDLAKARHEFGSRVALWVCPRSLLTREGKGPDKQEVEELRRFADWLQAHYAWETVQDDHLIVDLRKPRS
jgi:4-amino-4-deoxy-L-arabinose transferase-like glycosyltransferase